MRVLRHLSASTALVLVGLCAQAGTGIVLDQEGNPLTVDVQVCHFETQSRVELLCVGTDDNGAYDVIDSQVDTLRVSAPGFFPELVSSRGHQTVTLRRSPTLLVHALDAATGEPLERCDIWVVYPSAEKKGPFPATSRGLRITRILEPGKVRVFGRTPGYEDSAPVDVELEPGQESQATVKLSRTSD